MHRHAGEKLATVLLTKLGDLLRKDYDWSGDEATINAPTLLVFGDADAVRTPHAVQFFGLLGGGKKDGGWDGSGISKARLGIFTGPEALHGVLVAPTAGHSDSGSSMLLCQRRGYSYPNRDKAFWELGLCARHSSGRTRFL
jgi:hypothetical protein